MGQKPLPELRPLPETGNKGKYHIPPEQREQVYNYIGNLHKKHPQMKPERLVRKAAEHFKLKKLDA